MKKALILVAVFATFISISPTVGAQGAMKVAIIDMQQVFKEYDKTKEADSKLKERMSGYKKERDERMEDYRKLIEQIKGLRDAAQDPSLSEEARQEKQSMLEEKVNEARSREREIREFDGTTQKLFTDQSKRMRDKILEEIQGKIDEFAKGKYTMVFDSSGMTLNGTPTLIYSEGLTDLTDEIIASLNK